MRPDGFVTLTEPFVVGIRLEYVDWLLFPIQGSWFLSDLLMGGKAMKTSWKSLVLVGIGMIACWSIGATPARAQGFSFGYSGPGVSVGVGTAGYGYVPGGYAPGGYYGGYYGGYPPITPGSVVIAPVPRVVYRPPVYYGPGPWLGPRPFVGYRPYGRYHHYRW
jgi:hypothetical protein